MSRRPGRRRGNFNGRITSMCGDTVIRGDINHIISSHESLGDEAERRRDDYTAENHYQHAEHYKRELSERNSQQFRSHA